MQLIPETKLQNGKYTILRTLGQGGFGITYLAEQVALHRKVAIKEFFMKEYCDRDETTSHVTLGTSVGSKELVARFRDKFVREAQIIAELEHPNIVKIFDVFEENGTAYYVMEFLNGDSLSERVKKNGPLPEGEALKYIRQVAGALSFIHDRNSLHFDVKPSNILVNRAGDAILIDFGVSKHYDETGNQTSSTPVGISKGYAPLEQYQQAEISTFTPATDIYALGATLYTLLTGEVPPSASEIYEDGLPPMLETISKSTRAAIEKAMQPRRKDRPQNVAEFLPLLDGAVGEASPKTSAADPEATVFSPKGAPKLEPKPAPKSPDPKPAEKKKSKLWLWVLLGGIAAVAIIAAVFWGGRKENSPADGAAAQIDTLESVAPHLDSLHKDEPIKHDVAVAAPRSGQRTHDWVDLGLSVKWATCNVGASSPGENGSYFAWGETKAKSDYSWGTLRYCSDEVGESFTKYVPIPKYGTVDSKRQLDLSDDVARANWGGGWRMPTDAEWTELRTKCTWTWTTEGGKNGYEVKGKNGNSIFLPAAGYKNGSSINNAGSRGYYWTSSLNVGHPSTGWDVNFFSSNISRAFFSRSNGLSVRPVTE